MIVDRKIANMLKSETIPTNQEPVKTVKSDILVGNIKVVKTPVKSSPMK